MAEHKARISCLASGNGTNVQALIDACASGTIAGTIIKVTVNKKEAYAATRAENAQPPIPTDYFNLVKHGFLTAGEKDPQKVKDARFNYDTALAERILADKPDLIVLAGWMHVMSTGFLNPVATAGVPIINLHPALQGLLLGQRYCYIIAPVKQANRGANPQTARGGPAIKRAYDDFKAGKLENGITGIMIHYVVEAVDRGAPIITQKIQIQESESLEDLEQRMHGYEHELIVKATALLAQKIVSAKTSATS
ncbi:formyl transferase [Xylaria sp. CBS 124048]|nr:formyl transferase [Xylaria sp. CBS 124048]